MFIRIDWNCLLVVCCGDDVFIDLIVEEVFVFMFLIWCVLVVLLWCVVCC